MNAGQHVIKIVSEVEDIAATATTTIIFISVVIIPLAAAVVVIIPNVATRRGTCAIGAVARVASPVTCRASTWRQAWAWSRAQSRFPFITENLW